ncbi:hypothetical protein [Pontibacter beigongshangensis]|uniref:hypothetical protein n=1 Tax=Pontibacter beigongshangensis TaxID=2574733 RepID=UPI001650390D|nr:hypothetical protein [Pontibacter beigongshangensis]
MHRRRSIYRSTYTLTLLIIICFFAHNAFSSLNYDVLHINQSIRLFGQTLFIRDIFPFFDAEETGHYGETVRMDIQIYFYRLGFKVILFLFALDRLKLISTLNIFLREIPGREMVKMPYFTLLLVALFLYELLDFVFFAGQTDWRLQAITVSVALSMIVAYKKKGSSGSKDR